MSAVAGQLRSARIARVLEENGSLVIVLGAFALVLLVTLRRALVVDGWLALVSGRWIAAHGLPGHDTLTIWSHGRSWIDQQWLAQLTLYGLYRAGGFTLVLLTHAALATAGVVIAALLARRLGASARSTAWISVPVVVAYYPVASVMRPQSFAYPLFAATLWLVFADSRAPSRRVFATLPLLVLWANLHGSVLLGAGLVSLAGLVTRRSPVLTLAPWACVFASPYALQLPAYYKKILVGGDFKHFVSEWAPTTLTRSTAAVYLLVIGGMWLLGRAGGRLTAIEKLTFVATAVVAFQAVRNTGWLGLTALAVLPILVDAVRRPAVEPQRLNRLLATTVLAGAVVAVIGIAAKPQSWFTGGFPPAAARAAAVAAGPHGRVFATSPYADWLLWSEPSLAGRVAFDARFELLTRGQLRALAAFDASSARGYDVFVLDRKNDARLRATLGGRVVAVAGNVVVLRR